MWQGKRMLSELRPANTPDGRDSILLELSILRSQILGGASSRRGNSVSSRDVNDLRPENTPDGRDGMRFVRKY